MMINIHIHQNTKLAILTLALTGAGTIVEVDTFNEQQDTDTDFINEVADPVWDDNQIELFSSFDIAEMGSILFESIAGGREIHQFLKSVELLDDQSIEELDPTAYLTQLDHVKGVMSTLERSYDSVIDNGGDEDDAIYTVKLSAAALITTYKYPSYPILCGAINLLAKREMQKHG
jgi:hypothetical protein